MTLGTRGVQEIFKILISSAGSNYGGVDVLDLDETRQIGQGPILIANYKWQECPVIGPDMVCA